MEGFFSPPTSPDVARRARDRGARGQSPTLAAQAHPSTREPAGRTEG